MATNEVKAILTAEDRGYTSTMKKAMGVTEGFGSKVKSGLGFGALMKIGSTAVSVLGNSVKGLVTDINSTNAAWKTFRSNMEMIGKGDQVEGIQKRLQKYAAQTVYSSSDMANTFAQLEAVGVKNTEKLVIGFGNLAAAAENPKQAMKTLSTQGTQMAAKPMVTWQDFKLMLEQTPAGIAQVAKSMNMTTAELVKNVQDGKVKTEDFFKAVEKAGANEQLQKMATTYKTLGQATDGLSDSVAQKLAPAWDKASQVGINSISKLIDGIDKIDLDKYLNSSSIEEGFYKMMTDMGEWAQDFVPLGMDMIGNLITGIAAKAPDMLISAASMISSFIWGIASKLPELLVTGLKALTTFIKGIDSGSGTLFTSAFQIISEFSDKLITNLPAIISAGWELMKALNMAILKMIPKIILLVVNLNIRFVKTLLSMLPKLIAAGQRLMNSLKTAIWNGIVAVGNKAKAGAIRVKNFIINGLGSLWSAGANLISGLWDAISSKLSGLVSWAGGAASRIKSAISSGLGSLVSAGYDLIAGLWNGISSKFNSVVSSVKAIDRKSVV